ncbi:lipoxygenase family protein [Sandaracinus amylolyticus]|uniref:lipoxygenase family protein n=1 Tax=Sandaracinus amylolyticus TaxID=927083 RepID=UPI001F456AB6|nr:lipoxygenase family protein [Sandaracinus amylolyticus]
MRRAFRWDVTSVPPLAVCAGVPHEAVPGPRFVAARARRGAEIAANAGHAVLDDVSRPFDSIRDYERLFPVLGAPTAIIQSHTRDDVFAWQRIAGTNPMMIRRVDGALPEDFPVTDAHLAAIAGTGATLSRAAAEHRLYLLDYEILDGIPHGAQRYLPAPYALFHLADTHTGHHALRPVAIQIERRAHPRENPIYTPGSAPADWAVAKLMVQVADMNVHEMALHLWGCHFAMEPFAVGRARTLAPEHPIGILLDNHFDALIANNDLGRRTLIAEGGPVDRYLGGALEGSLEILGRARATWTFSGASFPRELASRGVADPDTSIPNYPFRDDGLRVWSAIEAYVRGYVAVYYDGDANVVADPELAAFATEVAAEDGGRIAGLEVPRTREELVAMLATLVFVNGPLHNAINATQGDFMTFVPNMPAAVWRNPMPAPRGSGERDLLALLPGKDASLGQISTLSFLASKPLARLGYYRQPYRDPAAESVAARFRASLAAIDKQIDRANETRLLRYDDLTPRVIPNSIDM